MSGDYTRFTFDPRNRYSGVLMQQGRVQLDSDWNEEIDILRRRIRTTTLDILGPVGVPYVVSPDAFKAGLLPGDLSIGLGRLYVDGIQVEVFAEDAATYNKQPFFPVPPPLPAAGDAVVYLDVWDREVTYIEDPDLLDVALGGPDTTTRRQTVWQVKVDPRDQAACGVAVGEPPSAGRLTSRAIAPPASDDPCILPPASGYRGLENRFYRVEIHDGGPLGTARFKWSRDNGSIVSVVRAIAVSGTQTTLTVNRIGRDQFLRFRVGDWVTLTDDHRELMGETGEMALIVNIDETNRQIVLDRALPTGTGRPFGATATQIAERHTRVQRWDQTGATNAVDGDGLVLTAAGPIPIEDGIEIRFSTDPAGGAFRVGDYWVFWARTATAGIEELTNAPPRGIVHHYVQLAAINGLGGANPVVTDCRPPPPQQGAGDCCCTIIVRPGENIQAGIDALPPQGGCVCLKTGLHVIQEPLRIARGSIVLKAESPGTTVRNVGGGAALTIGNPAGFRIEGIDVLGIDFEATKTTVTDDSIVMVVGAARVRVSHCGIQSVADDGFGGVHAIATDQLSVLSCRFRQLAAGIVVNTRCEDFAADGNLIDLAGREGGAAFFGVAYVESAFPCRITRNAVAGALFGILLNDNPFGTARSLAEASIIDGNFIDCPNVAEGPNASARPVAIDVAANGCTITANRIVYDNRFFIGIRVTGWNCEVGGNQIVSRRKEFDLLGPIAIAIGFDQGEETTFVLAGIVAHNTIVGPQNGIVCRDAFFLVVEGNVVETFLGFAITGQRVLASEFAGNRIGGTLSAIFLSDGRQNRIAGNDCRIGQAGITLLREAGPQIAGNRLDLLGLWGVFAVLIAARLDIVENRLVNCARAMPNVAFAVGCYAVAGEAHIADNEIMDTGSDGSAQATSNVDYGIIGDLILEARVSGNLVTYSNAGTRNVMREDRALIMRGFFEFSLGDNETTFGFPAQIVDNKFVGTGRSALVQLLEFRLNNNTFVRFERVSFDQNYCMHSTPPRPEDRQNDATVRLVGRRAIVMGNHVKATTRGWRSVNFNGMQGPFIGNITAGGATNHPDFPVTEAAFNLQTF
jgi:hypothetical protein